MRKKLFLSFAVLAIVSVSAIAFATDALKMLDMTKLSNGIPAGWELKVKDGKANTSIIENGGVKAICMRSEKASFSLQRKINVNIKDYPVLTWRWKVTELPKGGDMRKDSTDDQAAQIFVAFSGRDSISYVWDTTAPVGATRSFSVPLVMKVRIVAVASGPGDAGKWVTVTRNVYEDYKRLYGSEPPVAEGLRYQINSQHTGTTAESCLESVEFQR